LFRTKHFCVVEFHHHDRKHGKPDAQERAGLAREDQCFFFKIAPMDFRYGIVGYLFDNWQLFCMEFAEETKRIRRPTFGYDDARGKYVKGFPPRVSDNQPQSLGKFAGRFLVLETKDFKDGQRLEDYRSWFYGEGDNPSPRIDVDFDATTGTPQ
jgi:hypothetical protein